MCHFGDDRYKGENKNIHENNIESILKIHIIKYYPQQNVKYKNNSYRILSVPQIKYMNK